MNSVDAVAGTRISGDRAAVAGDDSVFAVVIQVTRGDRAGGADNNAGVGVEAGNAVQHHGAAKGLNTVGPIACGNTLRNLYVEVDYDARSVGPGNALAHMTAAVKRDAMTPIVEHAQIFDDPSAAIGAVLPQCTMLPLRMCGLAAGFI